MSVNWSAFTPYTALSGGLLIGLAATWLILFNGRIAGISGILGGLLQPRKGDNLWRICFIGGILLAPMLYQLITPLPPIQLNLSWGVLTLAGLLVGFGSAMGSGCTSGHGVCGLSRQSRRSIIATLTFMLSGFLTVLILRHLL